MVKLYLVFFVYNVTDCDKWTDDIMSYQSQAPESNWIENVSWYRQMSYGPKKTILGLKQFIKYFE